MKFQVKDYHSGSGRAHRSSTRIDGRVVRSDLISSSSRGPNSNQLSNGNSGKRNGGGNGYTNLDQCPAPPSHRILRNSEISSVGMRGGLTKGEDKKGGTSSNNNSTHHHKKGNNNNSIGYHYESHHHVSGGGGSGSSSGGGGEAIAAVWPLKFVIALTNKEKEEDFVAFEGSKLPQRPKKRAKFIQ